MTRLHRTDDGTAAQAMARMHRFKALVGRGAEEAVKVAQVESELRSNGGLSMTVSGV